MKFRKGSYAWRPYRVRRWISRFDPTHIQDGGKGPTWSLERLPIISWWPNRHAQRAASTSCLKKNKQNYFCYNYVKLLPILTIFGTMVANGLELYEVHSFSTSPNSRQCTTVMWQFGTSAINTVVHWHKLGEGKMSAPHIILDNLPSLCQKLSDSVEVWRSYNKNNLACFLRHGVCSVMRSLVHCVIISHIEYS